MKLAKPTCWAWLFPGQGGQFVGMARDLFHTYPIAREITEEAETLACLPLRRFALNGPSEALQRPDILEPLLAAIAVTYVDVLRTAGFVPSIVAGYSAGEVGAYYAAGVLSRADAFRVAVWRGRLLTEASTAIPGGMSAVLRLETAEVAKEVKTMVAQGGRVWIAAENAPRHTTVSGTSSDLAQLSKRLTSRGGEIHPVQVSGPWHGPWLSETAGRLAGRLTGVKFGIPTVPLYSGVTGRVEGDTETLADGLAWHLAGTIRWHSILDDISRRGFRNLLEVGAGRVLRDLARRSLPESALQRLEGVEGHNGGGGPLRKWISPSPFPNPRPAPVETIRRIS